MKQTIIMTCFILFLTFLKIGAVSFGGGYAMIPLIQDEVLSHGWMGLEEIINFIAVCESTLFDRSYFVKGRYGF